MFADGYYTPGLVIFFMLGNATERWSGSPDAALHNVRAMQADLPLGQPCIFMTSAPPSKEKAVRRGEGAQENLARAFAGKNGQCSFVPGFTAVTIHENLGNAANSRRNASEAVKDPFHPTESAARKFLKLQRAAIKHELGGN